MNTLIVGEDVNGVKRPVRVNTDGTLDVGLTVGDITIGTIGIDQATAHANEVSVLNFPADPATQTTLAALLAKVIAAPATSAKQDTGNSSLSTIAGAITACNTGAVTVASSALPTGAATAAKQPALGTAGSASTDVITVQGIASGVAQPVSGTVTANVQTTSLASSTAYEASHVIKAGAGTLFSLTGYNSGSAQFIQLHNSATVPANGGAPALLVAVPAQSTFAFEWNKGLVFSTGISVCTSSTGPVKTISIYSDTFFTAAYI